jgi:hypothetical protein
MVRTNRRDICREIVVVCGQRCLQLHDWMRTSESAEDKYGQDAYLAAMRLSWKSRVLRRLFCNPFYPILSTSSCSCSFAGIILRAQGRETRVSQVRLQDEHKGRVLQVIPPVKRAHEHRFSRKWPPVDRIGSASSS